MYLKYVPDFTQQNMEQVLKMLKYTLKTVVCLAIPGKNIKFYLTMFCLALKQIASPLILSKVLGPSWPGYWWSPTGLKPWKNHISTILEQEPPTTPRQCTVSLVSLTHTSSSGPNRHICLHHCLTNLVKTCHWTPELNKAFEIMKAMLRMIVHNPVIMVFRIRKITIPNRSKVVGCGNTPLYFSPFFTV